MALLDAVFGSPAAEAETDDHAWLRAMLEVERALALASARVGLIPATAAEAIAAACDPAVGRFDLTAIGLAAATHATPVIALVEQLRAAVPAAAAGHVHLAATSQDVLDTAAMLVTRRALQPAIQDAAAVADLLAGLARTHRVTPMLGRTLLQPAVPTSYGATCAARLVAMQESLAGLRSVIRHRLAAQLGGAAGTLAPAGEHGPALLAQFAAELDLAEPVTPWHTARGRVAELAAAVGVLAGELAGAAQDVVLLSGFGELAEGQAGGSSSMPGKRNPARAVLALACAHQVPGLVATVLAGMPQELQRSAGRWQAEWGTLTNLLRLLGGVAAHTRAAYQGLLVNTGAMARHLAGSDAGDDLGSADSFVDRALTRYPAAADLDDREGDG